LLIKALIVGGLLLTWVAPSAQAIGIDWTNFGSSAIGRTNLNGSGANQSTGAAATSALGSPAKQAESTRCGS